MTIKVDALTSWKLVKRGDVLKLPADGDASRRIRLDVNCEDQTWVYAANAEVRDVKAQFLGSVGPGMETIEFFAAGDVEVTFAPSAPESQESQVWLYTAEIEPNVSESVDAVSFTEIHQRKARNPELEAMMYAARINERRLDAKMAEMAAMMEQMNERGRESAGVGAAAGGGEGGGSGASPVEVAASGSEPASGGVADEAGTAG